MTHDPSVQPDSTRRPAGRPRTSPVSRTEILDAALAAIDAEGVEKFSVRRLSKTLGVTSPTIYNYFGDREQLLVSVTELVLRRIPAPQLQETWQEAFLESVRAYRAAVLDHPNLTPVLATRIWSEPFHGVLNHQIKRLADGGIPRRLHLFTLRATEMLVLGSGVLSGRLNADMPGDVADRYNDLRAAIAADDMNEEDSFELLCRAVMASLTSSIDVREL